MDESDFLEITKPSKAPRHMEAQWFVPIFCTTSHTILPMHDQGNIQRHLQRLWWNAGSEDAPHTDQYFDGIHHKVILTHVFLIALNCSCFYAGTLHGMCLQYAATYVRGARCCLWWGTLAVVIRCLNTWNMCWRVWDLPFFWRNITSSFLSRSPSIGWRMHLDQIYYPLELCVKSQLYFHLPLM